MKTARSFVIGAGAAGLVMAAAGAAHAGATDVYVSIESGALNIGQIDKDDNIITPGVRVFGGELGEVVPGAGDEPGFFADSFTPGGTLGFNIIDRLELWNPSLGTFTAATQTMNLSKGGLDVDTPAADGGFQAGFDFATADGTGFFDDHPEFLVTPADAGIYLLNLELTSPGLETSEPIWIVFDNENPGGEVEHDRAIDYVNRVIVPAPGAAGVLALAGVAAVRRRRA